MLTKAKLLEIYANRQIIINFYEEDSLVDRTGLFFDKIHIGDNCVQFTKEGETAYTLELSSYTDFVPLKGFSDYYAFVKADSRVELYFPH